MSKFSQLLSGIILISAGLAGFILYYTYCEACPFQGGRMGMGRGMGGMMHGMMREKKTDFSSNGERIFFTGINSKGEPIKNSHDMQGVGCSMCHSSDAQGMRMMMDIPPLNWKYLTDPKGHTHASGRSHPPFTESLFKACVLAGVDPAGNQLNNMMPRWQISGEDLDDLIEYLKTK